MRADGYQAADGGPRTDASALRHGSGASIPLPPRLARGCECPCHTGDDVFHIVPCCGSVLGSLRMRAPMADRGAT